MTNSARRGCTRWATRLALAALGLLPACAPPLNPAGDALKPPTSGDVFEGVPCSVVRPQTEPDLMAWDAGSRANLKRLREDGVIAVRYEAKGCNVDLELLPNCIGQTSKYRFSAYSANERRVARNASELVAQLPVGAARLSGEVKGSRALRTDYMLAGQYSLPPEAAFKRTDLRGPDCGRATHVVSVVYVGAFAMGVGESRTIEAGVNLLGARAGGASSAAVHVLAEEGEADVCDRAQAEGKEDGRCGVPLRIALRMLDEPAAAVCPEGSRLLGDTCVRRTVVTEVLCPPGARWDGGKCVATMETGCPLGLRFEAGRGCVAYASGGAPPAIQRVMGLTPAEEEARAGTSPLVCSRFKVVDPGNGGRDSGTGRVRDTHTGLTWARYQSPYGMYQSAASWYCSARGMRLPTEAEVRTITDGNRCSDAWPAHWSTWTSTGNAETALQMGREGDVFEAPASGHGGRALCVRDTVQ